MHHVAEDGQTNGVNKRTGLISGAAVPGWFVTPDGGVTFFAGAVTADLYRQDGKDRVVLLREWDVGLGKDKKTMTWTEVKGKTRLEFKKQ